MKEIKLKNDRNIRNKREGTSDHNVNVYTQDHKSSPDKCYELATPAQEHTRN